MAVERPAIPLDAARPVLAVPEGDLRLSDGRRLRAWAPNDPRRRVSSSPNMRQHNGWDGPKRMIVIASLDDTRFGLLLHVSVSYQDRDPPWADIKLVKALFFGDDTDAMMMLPSTAFYVAGAVPMAGRPGAPGGADSHVFHLNQIPERWEMW